MNISTLPRRTLRRSEAATSLGVTTKTIDRMVKAGKLHSFLEERTRLISAASVDEYLASRLREEAESKEADANSSDTNSSHADSPDTGATSSLKRGAA